MLSQFESIYFEEDHPNRLASQLRLVEAYFANGQVEEAVELFALQLGLAKAYRANGQTNEVIELLECIAQYLT